MSMAIPWWLANGGTDMGGRGGRDQLPIYPPGYRAQRAQQQTQAALEHVLGSGYVDQLDELLRGADLEAGFEQTVGGILGTSGTNLLNANSALTKQLAKQAGVAGLGQKTTDLMRQQQAADDAAAAAYWAEQDRLQQQQQQAKGPVMVARAGASADEQAQVAQYNQSKGYAAPVATAAKSLPAEKSFLETVTDSIGIPGLLTGAIADDAKGTNGPTMVASYGASPEEQAQVAQYNESKGLAPVVAQQVAASPAPSGNVLSQLLPGLVGAVVQATGGGAAQTPLGSLLGLGLGGPAFGSGPLPGNLGATVQSVFGTAGLPPAYARGVDGRLGLTGYSADPAWQQYASIGDYAGTTVARSLLGTTMPELQSIRAMLEHSAAQVQATHEAAVIASTRAFRREVIRRLSDLAAMVLAHDRRTGGPASVNYEARRY